MLVRLRRELAPALVSGGYLFLLFVGFQIDLLEAWHWIAAAIAVLALIAWVLSFKRAYAIADTPTAKIASAAQGYAEIIGQGKPLDGPPLLSRLRPAPCLWYRYKIERREANNKWTTIESGESAASFLIDDGSGQCLIDPEGAEILPRETETWIEGDHRYHQALIVAGERVYALGAFRTLTGESLALDVREDVKERLAEWKKDMPRLLARFDLDKDGTLDMDEWQRAREEAHREVERNHRELRAAPGIHWLGRPADGRLFLISTLPPEKLERHYLLWAGLHLAVFFTALVGFAMTQSA